MLQQNNSETNVDLVSEKKAKVFVIVASIAIPAVVTALHFMPTIEAGSGPLRSLLNFLPTLNATLNAITTIVLMFAFFAIKRKNIVLHRKLMTSALVLSILFLISYISYHSTTMHTTFPRENPLRTLYLIILNSHIMLSVIIVPMVLISFSRAISQRYDKHRKIARLTLPLWLYVTISGVVVYLMISPHYPF